MVNLCGKKIGRLTVIKECGKTRLGRIRWECLCDCGKTTIVDGNNLSSFHTTSCGCIRIENATSGWNITHGKTGTAEYNTWMSLKCRCYDKSNRSYKDYGGRGIRVCERWLNSFENFLADMGLRPSPKHSIDRFPDNDGDYSPTNCRWATKIEQMRNRRNNRWLEFMGDKIIIADLVRYCNVKNYSRIHSLLKTKTPEQIFDLYINKTPND